MSITFLIIPCQFKISLPKTEIGAFGHLIAVPYLPINQKKQLAYEYIAVVRDVETSSAWQKMDNIVLRDQFPQIPTFGCIPFKVFTYI